MTDPTPPQVDPRSPEQIAADVAAAAASESETPAPAEDSVSTPEEAPADVEAPSAEPVDVPVDAPPAAVSIQICQHALDASGETTIAVPKGTTVLDVHMIDGQPHVRTIERTPVEPDAEMKIICVPLGGTLKGRLQHVPARGTGSHFFVVQADEAPPAE